VKFSKSSRKTQYREGIKILVFYLKYYKQALVILGLLALISAAANSAVPYISGRLIDALISKEAVFFSILSLWFVIQIVASTIDWRIYVNQEKVGTDIEADYLSHGVSTLLSLPLSFHKQHRAGDIWSRLQRAANSLEGIISRIIIHLAPQFLSIIFALAFVLYIKPLLAAVLVLGMLIYIVAIFVLAPRLAPLFQKMHKAYSRAFGDAYDAVLNVAAVKQATAESYESRRVERVFKDKAIVYWMGVVSIWGKLTFFQRIVVVLAQLVIFLISFRLVLENKLTIGELVAFNGYAAMLFGPFTSLANNWFTVQNGFVALVRAEKLLKTPAEKYVPKNAVVLTTIKGKIEFRNVDFRYGKSQLDVLKNISFIVNPGEKVALVGESGVGKTTLADLVSLYFIPTKGKISVDGHDIKRFNLGVLRSQVAVVPQELMLFHDTIKHNISYGKFRASDAEIKKAAKFAHADEFIGKFPKKYNQIVGERGIRLSHGQKQRIAIARAILKNPRILILDEPTSALDAQSEKLIQESLRKLMAGRTTITIAHRFSTVREADKILVLENGEIAEQGKHEELIKKPDGIYRKLYELQMGLK